mmetsp:Transcript_124576/g.195213  ORF Transcript_124576/g.195213 Transcript_124576/m.195213 type:complete len:254 (+) Transcript_124576:789-1550(+)
MSDLFFKNTRHRMLSIWPSRTLHGVLVWRKSHALFFHNIQGATVHNEGLPLHFLQLLYLRNVTSFYFPRLELVVKVFDESFAATASWDEVVHAPTATTRLVHVNRAKLSIGKLHFRIITIVFRLNDYMSIFECDFLRCQSLDTARAKEATDGLARIGYVDRLFPGGYVVYFIRWRILDAGRFGTTILFHGRLAWWEFAMKTFCQFGQLFVQLPYLLQHPFLLLDLPNVAALDHSFGHRCLASFHLCFVTAQSW